MGASHARKAALEELPPTLAAEVAAAVRAAGALPLKKLTPLRLARHVEAALHEALGRDGLERTGKHVRVPLAEQIAALLDAEAGPVPIPTLKRRLKGVASSNEVAHACQQLIARGAATLVHTQGQEHLVAAYHPTLGPEELDALTRASAALAKLLKGTRTRRGQPPRALLADDVAALLAPFTELVPPWLERQIRRLASPEQPFVFVPDLARTLRDVLPPPALASALLAGVATGRWELRPESGVGLLTENQAALCPRSWNGEPLSFLRLRA